MSERNRKSHLVTLSAAIALVSALSLSENCNAQETNAAGTVLYTLPNTVLSLKVETVRNDFKAGPYADYAQKYLGSEAQCVNSVSYTISSIELTPRIEADAEACFSVRLPASSGAGNFLSFCSQGLIATAEGYLVRDDMWRFPAMTEEDPFAGKSVGGNLDNVTSTLYKTVQTETGLEKVAVQQSQVVEKSLEKKAAETAQCIFDLRKSRMQIITGDTDATFSGEALGAAIEEMARLEKEYMSLFYGVTVSTVQTVTFDIIPSADKAKQMYIPFRFSDSQGAVPANDISGRPIVIELTAEGKVYESGNLPDEDQNFIYYRVPVTTSVKVTDGTQTLILSRVPIYQFGRTASFPVKAIGTK